MCVRGHVLCLILSMCIVIDKRQIHVHKHLALAYVHTHIHMQMHMLYGTISYYA